MKAAPASELLGTRRATLFPLLALLSSACGGALWVDPIDETAGPPEAGDGETEDGTESSQDEGDASDSSADDTQPSTTQGDGGSEGEGDESSSATEGESTEGPDLPSGAALQVELSCTEDPSQALVLHGIPYVFHVGHTVLEEGMLDEGIASCQRCDGPFSLTFTLDPQEVAHNVTLDALSPDGALRFELCASSEPGADLQPYGSVFVTSPADAFGTSSSYELFGGDGPIENTSPGSAHELDISWPSGGLASTGEVPVLGVARAATPPFEPLGLAFSAVPHLPSVPSETTLSAWDFVPETSSFTLTNNTQHELMIESLSFARGYEGVPFPIYAALENDPLLPGAGSEDNERVSQWWILPTDIGTENYVSAEVSDPQSGQRYTWDSAVQTWSNYLYLSQVERPWLGLSPPTATAPQFDWGLESFGPSNGYVIVETCDVNAHCWTVFAHATENQLFLPPTNDNGLATLDLDNLTHIWGEVSVRPWQGWVDDLDDGFRFAELRKPGHVAPPTHDHSWSQWTSTWMVEL